MNNTSSMLYIFNMIIGYLPNSSKMLSGIGLTRTFSNVSISWGFTSALYTLIPQSIGLNKINLLQLYLQRSF